MMPLSVPAHSVPKPPPLARTRALAFAGVEVSPRLRPCRWTTSHSAQQSLTPLLTAPVGHFPLLLNPPRWRGRRWWRQLTRYAISDRGYSRLDPFTTPRSSGYGTRTRAHQGDRQFSESASRAMTPLTSGCCSAAGAWPTRLWRTNPSHGLGAPCSRRSPITCWSKWSGRGC